MSQDGVVDLSSPPETPALVDGPGPSDPLSSVIALAAHIDAHEDDVSSLINDLLSPYSDMASLDKALGSLGTRLSLLNSDTSSALEESIHDISRAVPRLTYDLQFMRESATTLQTSLSIVQGQVARQRPTGTDGDETYRSLERLTHLDKLKTRMESARGILREAESWSSLEGEITEYIQKEEWDKAGERLAEASKSLVVFQSTPGEYESRKTLLVSLQNELEGRLAKALEGRMSDGDVEGCARLREVFGMIERDTEYKKYYFASRRKGIVKDWTEGAVEPTGRLSTFLPAWFHSLSSLLQAEKTRIPIIFPSSSSAILASLIDSILEDLSPSLQARLGTVADYYGSNALPELIRSYKAAQDFASATHALIESMTPKPSEPPTLSPRSTTTQLSDTNNRRQSLTLTRRVSQPKSSGTSITSIVENGTPPEWESTLFDPFLDLQSTYGSLERRYLSASLPSSGSTTSRAMTERATTVFQSASEAIGRCMAFTHGYGALGLLDAIGDLIESFCDDLQISAPVSSTQSADELDFEGLDYSTKDWEGFQHGLHVLAVCRDMRTKLEKLEKQIHDALLSDTTESGAKDLLKQSTLNSADLLDLTSKLPLNPPSIPLKPARRAIRAFTKRTQTYIQSIILAPLKAQLEGYPSLSVWSAPEKSQKRGELHVPTFSLGPTETIARVSEGLLNLLRVFEVYATDDALAFSIDTLPFVDSDATGDLNAEIVLSTWVSSLSLSLLAHLTGNVLPNIRNLSTAGSSQLATDLAYLSNAVRALDVEWEELEKWREKVEAK